MATDATGIAALLEAWRAQGADRLDPVRFHRIAALYRRAQSRPTPARDVLDTRLAAYVDAYARHVAAATPTKPGPGGRGMLGQLADAVASRPRTDAVGANYPELPEVERFRALWSTLRTRTQVRESLARAPAGAGPLNSAALAHRALTLMGGAAPGYLQHFLSYVDTLSWLETLQDAGVLAGKDTAPPVGARPRRPRKRKPS